MNDMYDFRAPAMSWAQVDAAADSVRESFRLVDVPYFPVVDVVEKLLANRFEEISFEICTHAEMDGAEGLTCPKGKFIRIREDVYDEACTGGVRARFTFAHELGHLLLHTDAEKPLARALSTERLKPFRSAEKQANRFASTLLMPIQHISPFDDPEDLMQRFGVSRPAAGYRLDDLQKKGWT